MWGVRKCGCVRPYKMTIEKPSTTQDGAGHVDLTVDSNWTFVAKRSVSFKTQFGQENQVYDQNQADTTVTIEMNSDSTTRAIKPSWRGRVGNRKFNFVSVMDVNEMKQVVQIQAREIK